jgi:DNA repair protein RecO (recombination protein O)
MLQKLRGIVLHHINYGETSIILHLYTDLKGRVSVIIPGAKGKKRYKKISLYHNLSILDLEIYFKSSRELQQIKEAKPSVPLPGITADPIKSTVSLFLSEVLYRTLKEEEANPELFDFLENAIRYYDLADNGIANFHIFILVHLTRFLGIFPMDNHTSDEDWFNMKAGSFSSFPPESSSRMDQGSSKLLARLMRSDLDEVNSLRLNRTQRNDFLAGILDYYKMHFQGMGEIMSYGVLREIFE